jgi:phosphoglycolate phosphatase-like HAD superfamily hydrolase
METTTTVVLDVDGTLVDTNYQHVLAWQRAFRRLGEVVPASRIHRHIGMGGDRLVAEVAGAEFECQHGEEVREAEGTAYGGMIGEVSPFEGAQDLLFQLRDNGYRIVLASSSRPEEVEHYVDLLEARELADGWTTAEDVKATKPSSELIETALEIGGASRGAMIGDTTWDVMAARKAGIPCHAVLTGGLGALELRAAGATSVYRSVADLASDLERGARVEGNAFGGDGRPGRVEQPAETG